MKPDRVTPKECQVYIPNLGQTVRNVRRARELVQALIKFGFTDVVTQIGLHKLVRKGWRKFGYAKPDTQLTRLPREVRLRKAMEELGPTFVKMAQILATRPDLIPMSWAEEFAKLQHDVAQVPGEDILKTIREELGEKADTLFESIDKNALAAASVAQVHRATLRDGTPVVLKVLRPGIRDTMTADLEILEFFARLLEEHFTDLGYSPVETIEQFAREMRRETDLTIEARSTDRLGKAFENDPEIAFPRVHWDATTSRVLCLDYIDGQLLSHIKHDQYSHEERQRIVANGTRAVFRQCLEIGLFHADPHPGNIFVLRDDNGQAGPICFVDCGMTGHIDPKTSEHLADLIHGTASGELDRVVRVLITLSDADPLLADDREFRTDVWQFMSHFQDASFDDLRMGRLLSEFFEKARRHDLAVPADMVFLIKAITTIEGVGEAICPDFDIVSHVQPTIEKMVRSRYGIRALRRRLQNAMIDYAEISERLPRDFGQLLTAIRHQKLTVNLEHHGLQQLTRSVDSASHNITRGLIITALIVASSILILANSANESPSIFLIIPAVAGFLLAAVMGVLGFFNRNP